MDLRTASDAFLRHCRNGRNLSPNTLKAYAQDLAELMRYLALPQSMAPTTPEGLTSYAEWLSAKRCLAPATVKRRLACLRALFHWAERQGQIAASPFRTAEICIRLPKRLPRCLTAGELRILFRSRKSAPPAIALAILLLFTTGMRVAELCSLRISDIDLDRRTLRIRGKGDRERQVFLVSSEVVAELKGYLRDRHRKGMPPEARLLSPTGEVPTTDRIRRGLRKIADAAGLTRRITPHMLRHSAATSLLDAGIDIRFVQRLLGHRSISTTEIYTHVSDERLKQAVSKANVLARLSAG